MIRLLKESPIHKEQLPYLFDKIIVHPGFSYCVHSSSNYVTERRVYDLILDKTYTSFDVIAPSVYFSDKIAPYAISAEGLDISIINTILSRTSIFCGTYSVLREGSGFDYTESININLTGPCLTGYLFASSNGLLIESQCDTRSVFLVYLKDRDHLRLLYVTSNETDIYYYEGYFYNQSYYEIITTGFFTYYWYGTESGRCTNYNVIGTTDRRLQNVSPGEFSPDGMKLSYDLSEYTYFFTHSGYQNCNVCSYWFAVCYMGSYFGCLACFGDPIIVELIDNIGTFCSCTGDYTFSSTYSSRIDPSILEAYRDDA